jgi:hypothetical protein
MKKLSIALAAAGLLLAMPTMNAPAAADPAIKLAQADVKIRIGDGDRRASHRRYHRHHSRHCSTKVIIRDGRKTVIKRCRGR